AGARRDGTAPLATATSDADGRFEIACQPEWSPPFAIEAGAPGHESATQDAIVPGREVTVVLSGFVVVSGRVLAAGTQAPVACATVSGGRCTMTTDATGGYELQCAIFRGVAHLSAHCAGFVDEGLSVRVHDQRRCECDIVLQPSVALQ